MALEQGSAGRFGSQCPMSEVFLWGAWWRGGMSIVPCQADQAEFLKHVGTGKERDRVCSIARALLVPQLCHLPLVTAPALFLGIHRKILQEQEQM